MKEDVLKDLPPKITQVKNITLRSHEIHDFKNTMTGKKGKIREKGHGEEDKKNITFGRKNG